jgi:hypothetical protein
VRLDPNDDSERDLYGAAGSARTLKLIACELYRATQ